MSSVDRSNLFAVYFFVGNFNLMEKKNKNKQLFLETFFDNEKKYSEKEVNGFWLVRYKNGDYWPISIYTKEKFANMKMRTKLFPD